MLSNYSLITAPKHLFYPDKIQNYLLLNHALLPASSISEGAILPRFTLYQFKSKVVVLLRSPAKFSLQVFVSTSKQTFPYYYLPKKNASHFQLPGPSELHNPVLHPSSAPSSIHLYGGNYMSSIFT
jgi:hypothetical protein